MKKVLFGLLSIVTGAAIVKAVLNRFDLNPPWVRELSVWPEVTDQCAYEFERNAE